MPTDETIAALLSLPTEAREALKKPPIGTPGWAIAEDGSVGHLTDGGPLPPALPLFLPCSPLEIVKVAAEKAGHHRYLLCRDECERDGVWFVAECGYCDKSQEAGSPHLAALALLAEVWR